jgi:hypothetical protein
VTGDHGPASGRSTIGKKLIRLSLSLTCETELLLTIIYSEAFAVLQQSTSLYLKAVGSSYLNHASYSRLNTFDLSMQSCGRRRLASSRLFVRLSFRSVSYWMDFHKILKLFFTKSFEEITIALKLHDVAAIYLKIDLYL